MFDQVQRWATANSATLQGSSPVSRECFIRKLRKKVYGYTRGSLAVVPSTNRLILSSNEQVSVTTFPFISSLVSILSNKELMREENLLLNSDNPFSIPSENSPLGDVNTGRWYRDTWNKLCVTKNRDILLNIIGFSDETTVDKYGKQSLHPFSITLGIFNRATRNLAQAWTNLGYFPKLKTSKSKMQERHDIYSYLMRDLRKIEDEGGFRWDLKLNGKVHKVVFKIAFQFIIGDCEGHDEICGRKKGHSLNMKGLCRDCDCLPVQADDPDHQCNFFKTDRMESLSNIELANIGFHQIENAFYDVELGSNPGGIFNATPPEHLHQMAGLADYFFAHLESVLGNPSRSRFDVTIMQIVKNYSHQSEKGFHSLSPF